MFASLDSVINERVDVIKLAISLITKECFLILHYILFLKKFIEITLLYNTGHDSEV